MTSVTLSSSNLGTSLQELLMSDEIQPGAQPSYQLCRTIYTMHPLGKKMVDSPITMAQSQPRDITVPNGPEERVRDAFVAEWNAIKADDLIANVARTARMYGIASIVVMCEEVSPADPLPYEKLAKLDISFNVLDPLNTAGSLVLNQDPNSPEFQKVQSIRVSGKSYHRSRACVLMNEQPLYIEFTQSAFGFVGRSVYQRALFPLKSFIRTMVTDDVVTQKAGVLVAMIKAAGSVVDKMMGLIMGQKRQLLKEAETGNVISIGDGDSVQSLDFTNMAPPMGMARKNILENIAVAADMPAKLLNSETFAEGFGEGTEDAKQVARFVDRVRIEMNPVYAFFDEIVQRRAWNPEFYAVIQKEYPEEYGKVAYNEAFYRWKNSFSAVWPSLLKEPESEEIKVDDVRLKAVIALFQVLAPELDPDNKAVLMKWAADNFNERKMLFSSPLNLDYEALSSYEPPQPMQEPSEPKPFAATDAYDAAVSNLTSKPRTLDAARIVKLLETMKQ